ncbi:MAG: ribosome small subunit-dependent GTPase A [Defluviitaleaceae bacterium]|nr:ribosome small subunit-dependent GTPase A [Defluviitaleaceae bacterium]
MNREGLITKGVGGEYTVVCDNDTYVCTARGVFRNRQITPYVGDYVIVDTTKNSIDSIKPRSNMLRRPPVANIDQVIVTMAAAQPAFHEGLLDRFLVQAAYEGIDAVICINKYDLQKGPDTPYLPYIKAGYPVVKLSTVSALGFDELKSHMQGKLNVFAGPSGVGKSSIINALVPGADMEIGEISKRLRRGRHTTRHAEILRLDAGYVVDTPGFSSLEVEGIPARDFAGLFLEFAPYLGMCKFSDCMHDKETDCAVKAQVGDDIHLSRYNSYLGFVRDASGKQ